MKKIQLLSVILLTLVGCQKVEDSNNESKLMSFIAGIEVPTEDLATRTILGGLTSDANRSVLWEFNDQICVANGTSYAKFTNQTEGASDLAVFEGSLAQGANYYAAYPYDMVTGYSSAGFEIELPSVQSYCKDGVASGSFPMVAQCKDGIFNFKNLCGIFVIQLIGEHSISSIVFSGKDVNGKEIPIAGQGTVSVNYSVVPSLNMNSSSETKVILNCKESVKLNKSTPVLFHIVLPAVTYDTFDLVITSDDGSEMIIHSDKELAIKRSTRTTAASLTYSPAVIDFSNSFNLNSNGETANCYIISEAGIYKFKSVQGNSSVSVGEVSSVEVLWESFGTDVTPKKRDLIKAVSYDENNIYFATSDALKEGNAVIAAKNSSGEILWSWHIWLTDEPEGQVYFNDAGTMMDRNLGATSATPGDVGALGLLYQWGRKDPFLGSSSISSSVEAKSTVSWPSVVSSSSSIGTIAYATKNPMRFITYNDDNRDWYYTGNDTHDNSRWQSEKTIYDPCPAGWRVPDGGDNGIWSKAFGSSLNHYYVCDDVGLNFSGEFGSDQTIWYPASGSRYIHSGWSLNGAGSYGNYWSVTPNGFHAYDLCLEVDRTYRYCLVYPSNDFNLRSFGQSVRCLQE